MAREYRAVVEETLRTALENYKVVKLKASEELFAVDKWDAGLTARLRTLNQNETAISGIDDAIFEAVKAANSTEGFTGEGGVLSLSVASKSQILKRTEAVPDFDIRGIFGEVANTDYERAVQLARGFQGEAPRANATIAIARSVLNEKSATTPAVEVGLRGRAMPPLNVRCWRGWSVVSQVGKGACPRSGVH